MTRLHAAALTGRKLPNSLETQGVALGYVQLPLQGVRIAKKEKM